jgi:predicted nucleotidyltransferase
LVQAALGDNFIGAYLQGSFAVGDADEDSDVDFLVATVELLADREVMSLNRIHVALYERDKRQMRRHRASLSEFFTQLS